VATPRCFAKEDAFSGLESHQLTKETYMKLFVIIAVAAVAGLAGPALAANEPAGHGQHAAMPDPSRAEMVEGLVKKIDKNAGKVTLSDGPMPNGMPAMTMVFRVKEAAWVDQMKEGGKIRFQADQVNGAVTVVRFEPVK
jgi:Cu(I)/Ag(I) efflux system periplasmic protein CusF